MTEQELVERRRLLTRSYDLRARGRMLSLHERGTLAGYLERLRIRVGYQLLPHYFSGAPRWRLFLRRFGGARTVPDFYVISPIKSGSSDLAVNLMLNPAVMTPLAKELRYPRPSDWRLYYPTEREKRAHAARHGAALSPYLSPHLHRMDLAHFVAEATPAARVVLALREPAARTYSHWKWEYLLTGARNARELPFLRDFPSYVERSLEAFGNAPMYSAAGGEGLLMSIYWQSVQMWIDAFGRERVLVVDLGAYWRDRNHVLRRIQDFVGLPRQDVPGSEVKVNQNPLPLPAPDADSMRRLRTFFEPYNEKLWRVIGEEFDWPAGVPAGALETTSPALA